MDFKSWQYHTLSVSGSLINKTWSKFLRTILRYSLLSVRGFSISTPSTVVFDFSTAIFVRLGLEDSFFVFR